MRKIYPAGLLLVVGMVTVRLCGAQDYHALQGSNHAGALGAHFNPASLVNTPYPWDLTIGGIQAKYQTNAIRVVDYSLLSSPYQSAFVVRNGSFSRYGNAQVNLNLMNLRYAPGRKSALAAGVNLRSYSDLRTDPYQYVDTVGNYSEFFSLNPGSDPYNARLRSSSFLEIHGSYGRTLWDNSGTRLNAGLTVRVNRGLSGARADVEDLVPTRKLVNGVQEQVLTGGRFAYGYSRTYDRWDKDRGTANNLRDMLAASQSGFSFDLGLELLVKPAGEPGYMEDEESYYDYDWKLGLSVLDIGSARYRYSVESRSGRPPGGGVAGSDMDEKLLEGIVGISGLNDSLATLFNMGSLGGMFRVWHPTRLVLNADRFISGGWYVNSEISLNLFSLAGKDRLGMRNMNFLRVTPRWESRRWGVYLPLLFNHGGRAWLGAAFKAGPLLLGFHHLGNIFSKDKMASGGGYLALTLRPSKLVTAARAWKRTDCAAD